jgi:hypothetical protein
MYARSQEFILLMYAHGRTEGELQAMRESGEIFKPSKIQNSN